MCFQDRLQTYKQFKCIIIKNSKKNPDENVTPFYFLMNHIWKNGLTEKTGKKTCVTTKLLERLTISVRQVDYNLLIKRAYTSLDNSDYMLVWNILSYLIN